MATAPARKQNLNRRSIVGISVPPRSPTPSRESLGSGIPVASHSSSSSSTTGSAIGRRHTIREGLPGHSPHGSLSSLRAGASARSVLKRSSISGNVDDTELEKDATISDLTQRVKSLEANAQAAAENFADQVKALQSRTEEAVDEATRMEEQLHSKDEEIEGLQAQIKDLERKNRDQEHIYEAERLVWSQEKEELYCKEEELNATIQRLKENITEAQKEKRAEDVVYASRSSAETKSDDRVQFAPQGTSSPSPPPLAQEQLAFNNLVMQKDKLIHSLRLELAEYEVRLTQVDHMGGSRVSELEQRLLEAKMTNARLMEEIESYQLLISTATLNGDFSRTDIMTNAFSDEPRGGKEIENGEDSEKDRPIGSSLADELEHVEEEEAEHVRKLEAEVKSLRDQNKALTLYINNIIERLLNHKDFEAILDKTPSLGSIQAGQQEEVTAPPPPPATEKPKFFSLVRKTPAANKPVPAPPAAEQEPSPLQRSQSMRVTQAENSAAFNGPPQRASTFASNDGYTARPPRSRNSAASSASIASSASDHSTATDLSSPTSPYGPTGAIVGNKLRPLRLVQENSSAEEEKKNKRSSWMGWFNRGKEEESSASSVVFDRKAIA